MVENVDLSGCNLAPRAFSKISHKKAELALSQQVFTMLCHSASSGDSGTIAKMRRGPSP